MAASEANTNRLKTGFAAAGVLLLGTLTLVPTLLLLTRSYALPEALSIPLALAVGPISLLPLILIQRIASRSGQDPCVRIALLSLTPSLLIAASFDAVALWHYLQEAHHASLYLAFEQSSATMRSFCLSLAAVISLGLPLPGQPVHRGRRSWFTPLLVLICLAVLQILDLRSNLFLDHASLMVGVSCMAAVLNAALLLRAAWDWRSPLMAALALSAGLQVLQQVLYLTLNDPRMALDLLLAQNLSDLALWYTCAPLLLGAAWRAQIPSPPQERLQPDLRQERAAVPHQALAHFNQELLSSLHTLIGYSETLADQTLAEPGLRQSLQRINQAGWDVLRVLDELSDLDAVEKQAFRLQPAAVDAQRFALILERMATKLADPHFIVVSVHATPALGSFHADEARLLQICLILVRNAIRHTRDGRISLHIYPSCRDEQPCLAIDIRDSGSGMSEAELRRVLDHLASSSAPAHPCRDIGLPLVHRLCSLMGAHLDIESRPGFGSTFRIHLPDADLQTRPLAAGEKNHEAARILVIDSQQSGNEDLVRMLGQDGSELLQVQRARSGLRVFFEKQPDLVVADLSSAEPERLDVIQGILAQDAKIPLVLLHVPEAMSPRAEALIQKAEHAFSEQTPDKVVLESIRSLKR